MRCDEPNAVSTLGKMSAVKRGSYVDDVDFASINSVGTTSTRYGMFDQHRSHRFLHVPETSPSAHVHFLSNRYHCKDT